MNLEVGPKMLPLWNVRRPTLCVAHSREWAIRPARFLSDLMLSSWLQKILFTCMSYQSDWLSTITFAKVLHMIFNYPIIRSFVIIKCTNMTSTASKTTPLLTFITPKRMHSTSIVGLAVWPARVDVTTLPHCDITPMAKISRFQLTPVACVR